MKIAGALSMIVAATAAAKTAAAQTPLAKAKGNHARAKAALTNADALATYRKADLEQRVRQTAAGLREAARREAERREAERALPMTPDAPDQA